MNPQVAAEESAIDQQRSERGAVAKHLTLKDRRIFVARAIMEEIFEGEPLPFEDDRDQNRWLQLKENVRLRINEGTSDAQEPNERLDHFLKSIVECIEEEVERLLPSHDEVKSRISKIKNRIVRIDCERCAKNAGKTMCCGRSSDDDLVSTGECYSSIHEFFDFSMHIVLKCYEIHCIEQLPSIKAILETRRFNGTTHAGTGPIRGITGSLAGTSDSKTTQMRSESRNAREVFGSIKCTSRGTRLAVVFVRYLMRFVMSCLSMLFKVLLIAQHPSNL